jgi:polysaccharide biosynthesis protein PslJ
VTDLAVAPPLLTQGSPRKANAVALLTVYTFLLMAIPSRLIFSPLGGAGAPSTIVGALLLVWYLLNWVHSSSPMGRGRQPMRYAGLLLFCAVLVSYVSANLHALSTLELNGADRGIIRACEWLGVLLIAADGIDSIDRLRTLLRRIVLGGTAMAVLGIVQFFTKLNAAQYIIVPGLSITQPYTDIGLRGHFNRPSATAIHPIEFGFVLAMILPIAIHQARYAPPNRRLLRWLQVFLIAGAMPMTVSRSAILGLLVCLIVILPTWPARDRRVAYVAVVLGILGLRAVVPGLVGTLRNLFLAVGSDSSTQSRTSAFGHAAPLISAHPLFGQGLGTFIPTTLFYTDDQYLNSLIEIGFVGLFALLGVFVTGWVLARRTRRAAAAADAEGRHLAQCLAATAAVALVVYATFDALYFPMATGITFLLLGCIAAAWRLAQTDQAPDLTQQRAAPAGS